MNESHNVAEAALRNWMSAIPGAERYEIELRAIGRLVSSSEYLYVDGKLRAADPPVEVLDFFDDVRDLQVLPGRGAWTCGHFWMVAGEWVLRSELDWMSEPIFDKPDGPRRPAPHSCHVELELYPRDPEFIPEWMAAGAAQWDKHQADLARRRERDRARRAAKRAEKAAKETQQAQQAEPLADQAGDATAGQAPSV